MQSKGLVVPRHPYKSAIHTKNCYRKQIALGGSLTNDFHRHNHCRGLSSFTLFASSPEQSDPSPEPTSSEAKDPKKEAVSLSSWADDVSQSPSTNDSDWGPPPANSPQPGRHPITNALFALSLGGIAVGAFILGRKYNAYNRAMVTEPSTAQVGGYTVSDGHHGTKRDIVSGESTLSSHNVLGGEEQNLDGATAIATSSALPRKIIIAPTMPHHRDTKENTAINSKNSIHEEEKHDSTIHQEEDENFEEMKTDSVAAKMALEEEEQLASDVAAFDHVEMKNQQELVQNSEIIEDAPPPSSSSETANKKEEEEKKHVDQVHQEPSTSTPKAISMKQDIKHDEKPRFIIEKEEEKKEESSPPKFPLRTAEAEAALERIRAIQQRRQELYDKAIARQENKLKLTAPLTLSSPSSSLSSAPSATAPAEEVPRNGIETSLPSGSLYMNEDETETHSQEGIDMDSNSDSLIRGVDIPKGMSLKELRERAVAANRAAAASATAAHRAAAASALAADAADTATHAAQQASLAAAQCQSALDLRSADAIEEAYRAAIKAEEQAEMAARQAAVGSAKAVVSKRDAEKKAQVASKAAELSAPHGVVAQTSAFWRQLRRETAAVAETTNENVQAGVAAAGWMWNEGSEKVQNAWKGVQKGLPARSDIAVQEPELKEVVAKSDANNGKENKGDSNSDGKRRGFFFRRSKK